MNSQKYIVVDIETTGHSPAKGDRIIQLAMVTIEHGEITDTYTKFINPQRKIPAFIQDLTNITEQDVVDAEPFESHAEEVYSRLEGTIFVAHNIHFDLPFLQAELKRAGLPMWHGLAMDTVELARLVYPTAFSYKLQDIVAEQGIALESAHRADDDAFATAELFLKAKQALVELPYDTLVLLHKRSFQLKSDLSRLLFEITQQKRNSQADRFKHFRGIPIVPKTSREGLESSEPLTDWRSGLEKIMPNYENRPSQVAMMRSIDQAIRERKELVIEASTGMGKTLGYLLPAASYALESGKQVVVSTYTTHLQDQLVSKEVKLAEQFLGTGVRVSLIKGLTHYIDLSRFFDLLHGDDESYDETFTIMQILVWLTATRTGDLNELNASSGGQLLIDKVRRSHLRKLSREEKKVDFYEYALTEAEHAHVIVTNHAFLLNPHTQKRSVLKNVDAYIWDEAHQVVQAAVAHKEKTFVYTQWRYVFGQIGSFDENQLFASFYRVAEAQRFARVPELLQMESLFLKYTSLFDVISLDLAQAFQEKFHNSRQKKCAALLDELNFEREQFLELLRFLNSWIDMAQTILQKAERFTELTMADRLIIADFRYWTEELLLKAVEFSEIFVFPKEDEVSWVEGDLRSMPTSLSLYKRPYEVASLVDKVVGQARGEKAIIWLSGTMSVPSNERFIVNQLGIPLHVPIEKFEPADQFYSGAKVYIVEDMPDIQQVAQHEYIESVADAVSQTVLVTEGRCFVLFTSQDMLRKTVDLIQDSQLLDDYMLFAQGMSSGSRMKLLKSFQRFQKSVLFGTNSFWEGVDVPGDALRAVVVVRLPFTSPEEPVFKAKSRIISKEGINPFLHYALPEAVLRLRQGFGRLIRSKNDKGLFIVLDRRIETKSYGQEFLQALPDVPIAKVSLEKMVTDIEHWYNKQG
ncbi:ATP-dependent DNA helicase DinG [Planococcus sp. ISL-109]|uniref:ATP-dependent DNA helicase DinG n=1 Tax=Planococcus sp. ISL-109 TaxID=2819166 RepID=UPI001BEA66BC|nr:ATP-dependent DNA helicase DinG [Planococcus sp. ISL-109]MBT2582067.1 ATP-dependent DNA helicase DinG [Planococcus sp. ISL-109]